MSDFNEIVKLLKKSSIDAVNSKNPVNIVNGEVTSSKPLKVKINSKLILDEEDILLTKHLTDYKTELDISFSFTSHTETHNVKTKADVIVKNSLKINDKIVLISYPGGQKYIIIGVIK